MAKRKRKPGSRKGFTLRPIKDYRSDEYIPYVMKAEIGILQASTIDSDLTDGDVRKALESLTAQLKKPDAILKLLPDQSGEVPETSREAEADLIQSLILTNLRAAFDESGPLEAEDMIGILKVINVSVGKWNVGLHKRGYLDYIEDFLGGMGVNVRQLSQDEVKKLGLDEIEPPSK
jgi:hypothetical protein